MKQLVGAIAETAEQLQLAAAAIGGSITVDPRLILRRDPALNLRPPGLWSPNRHCRMVAAQGGWIAVNLAREDDRHAVPAWTGCDLEADPWQAVIAHAADHSPRALLEQASLLHLPVAIVGETQERSLPALRPAPSRQNRTPTAVDLSALWAGPLCGALLAEAGVDVTRIESASRPDPTLLSAPDLDRRLNGQKRKTSLALDDPQLTELIAQSGILITSARPHALAHHGLTEERLFTLNPDLIWVAVTAHGWHGEGAMRIGFGDDCAASGGLVSRMRGRPRFMGDALADPLTGLDAALAVMNALDKNEAGLIDMALAQSATYYARKIGVR